jgi:transketolase
MGETVIQHPSSQIIRLQKIARQLRVDVVKSLAKAGSGHLGASVGLADLFSVLYFSELNHRPKEPHWSDRDRLILSIGHVAPILYAALARSGYFPIKELETLRMLGSRLQGHPGKHHGLPGIEISTGSLGQGLSAAVGMALCAKLDKKDYRVFCIVGDGECQEGQIWEALMSASHYKLDNLTVIVDMNHVQIDGPTENVMSLGSLSQKATDFGFEVWNINGNNIRHILDSFDQSRNMDSPVMILAETVMGKGIKPLEGDYKWHGKAPSPEEVEVFINYILG